MISQNLLNQMDQKNRDMIQIFQMVFNENELNLITRVFGAEKLAVMMKMSTLFPHSGRIGWIRFGCSYSSDDERSGNDGNILR